MINNLKDESSDSSKIDVLKNNNIINENNNDIDMEFDVVEQDENNNLGYINNSGISEVLNNSNDSSFDKNIINDEDDAIAKLINHISLEDKKEVLKNNLNNSNNLNDNNLDDIRVDSKYKYPPLKERINTRIKNANKNGKIKPKKRKYNYPKDEYDSEKSRSE